MFPIHRKDFRNCLSDQTICKKTGVWRIVTEISEEQQKEMIGFYWGNPTKNLVDKQLVFINKRSGGCSIGGREIVDFNEMAIGCLRNRYYLVSFDTDRIQTSS